MDYYESTRPEVDDSGLSGGVTFKIGGQIASVSIPKSYVGANYQRELPNNNGGGTTLPYESHTGDGTAGYNVTFAPVNDFYIVKGSNQALLNGNELTITSSDGSYGSIYPSGLEIQHTSGNKAYLAIDNNNVYLRLEDVDGNFIVVNPATKLITIHDGPNNKEVTIDVPTDSSSPVDATWQEIDICVNGTPKKMKVLGTAPY
jgi:hypothetical protein